jgi:hypothetical protein
MSVVLHELGGIKRTELVLFFEVHVDDTARPNTGHLGSVQSTHFGKQTRARSVASVLGEEDRDVVLLKLLGTDVEARLLERRVTTPRVDVVTPEINRIILVATVKVSSQVLTDSGIIVGSITDTNGAIVLALDVGLGITDSGLDESAGNGVVWLIGDLVTSKEAESVVVLHHLVHDAHVAAGERGCPSWSVTNDGVLGFGQICYNVDASISERIHAGLVVLGRVDGIDTNGVCLDLLEEFDVTLARSSVGERVGDLDGAIDRLCGV